MCTKEGERNAIDRGDVRASVCNTLHASLMTAGHYQLSKELTICGVHSVELAGSGG